MMSGSKAPSAIFFLLIFCFASLFKLCYSIGKDRIINPCPLIEKQALIGFKQSLKDPSNLLSSWNSSREANCCNWKGVVCSNLTGHVHQLHLQGEGWLLSLQGQINPSLLNLKQLKYLDLSQNNFGETIPSFVGSLSSLEYLNLSYAGFQGRVPHNIGNLSNLRSLSLEGNQRELVVDNLEWLSGLSRLEHLNMNGVNLSGAAEWAQVISTLPALVELRLGSCSLDLIAPAPLNDFNTTSLAILDLSRNNFESFPIPKWIFHQINLVFLDLSGDNFEGPIPATSNITKLQYMYLSGNNINSSIPAWLYFCKDLEVVSMSSSSVQNTISDAIANLTSLITLDLSYNELSGKIPRGIATLCKLQGLHLSGNYFQGDMSYSFGNMSDCFLGSLTSLVLSENQLSGNLSHDFEKFKSLKELDIRENSIAGEIPTNLGKLSLLEGLDLRENSLTGEIPTSLGKLSNLKRLWLSDNKLTRNLPVSVGQLSNLEYLSIEDNMLEGVVTESHFANLTNLRYLSASRNHLTLKVSPNWIPPFNLATLELGSWDLGAGLHIPSWLQTQKNLWELDLSDTGISGGVPTWFWDIRFLNLSHNNLNGKIPDISGPEQGPRSIYLNSNRFSGSLPRVGNTVEEINLSDNFFSGGISHLLCDMTNQTYRLSNLHLGGNQLTGEIPDCWMKWPFLIVLNIGNNNLSGSIPNSIGFLADLRSLNLYGNKLSGQIPNTIRNCTELVKMDLSSNGLIGNIPTWMGTSLNKLRFLILRNNRLSGVIPLSICHLNNLQILVLSDNVFSGAIPTCVGNFTAMATKRNLTEYVGGDLDFSSYYFGNFPESASVPTKGSEFQYGTILSLVTNIDLSNNNFSGEIPKEMMSLVELRSLNLSGNHLTGLIPENIGDMKQLESLDFSRNSLVGDMPNSFTVMSSLNYLNLSYNNLTGKIPESTQLLGMNASSFIGNNLCGPPLTSNCGNDDDGVGRAGDKEENEDDKSVIEWFYVFLSVGYAVGLSIFCTALVLKREWRDAYFRLLQCMWDKIYVYFHIKWAKLVRA